jgi:nicotinamide-nucleotide amidase
MFQEVVRPILQRIVGQSESIGYRSYRIVGMGESYVEEAVGADLLRIPGLELGYCARMGEVDLRVIGSPTGVEEADAIVRLRLTDYIVSTRGRAWKA